MPDRWRSDAAWTAPEPGTIDVWRLPLRVRAEDWPILSPDEAERAKRIVIDAKRDQKASARAHLRRILARYRGVEPAALSFDYGEHGKPTLAAGPSFNLSHSEHIGLLAVTDNFLLGVDVEHARPGRAFETIAERFFSGPERDALLALAPDRRPAAFYRAWTRKEAYLKAHGTGLSFASNRFTIEYTLGSGRVLETRMPGDDPARWRFVDLDVDPDFAAAVCHEGGARRVRLWETG